MKKVFFSISLAIIIFFSSGNVVFGQQFVRFNLTEGQQAVNRSGPNLWINVNMANSMLVDSIKFKVLTTTSSGPIKTIIVPARPVKANDSTDLTKWTIDTTRLSDSVSRFLMIASNQSNYFSKSSSSRKIMEFFPYFKENIPLYGTITVKFYEMTVVAVNENGTLSKISLPDVSITINLGVKPPDENDSLQLRTEAGNVNRQMNEARIKLFYKSNLYSFGHLSFKVYPSDLTVKSVEFVNSAGKKYTLLKVGDSYQLDINNSQGFPPTKTELLLAEIILGFNADASGTRNIVLNTFQAWDLANQPLKVSGNLSQLINLGDKPPQPPDSLYLKAVANVDSIKKEANVNLFYSGTGWDTLTFNLTLPPGIELKKTELSSSLMTLTILGSRIKIVSKTPWPNVQKNVWANFLNLTFGYSKVEGKQTLVLDKIIAKRGQLALVVPTQPLIVNFDLGSGPPDTAEVTSKYFLFRDNAWFYLDRPNGQGSFSFVWMMDNLSEATAGISFDIELPYYMRLQKVVAFDAGKNVNIQTIADYQVSKVYHVTYSANDKNNSLLPNSPNVNPRAIMGLTIDYVDLPPYLQVIPIRNIVAYRLDGQVINQTKVMKLEIDWLNEIYLGIFKKGDPNPQFGDLKFNQADLDLLRKIINGRVIPTLYQAWACDMDGSGVVDYWDEVIWRSLYDSPNSVKEAFPEGELVLKEGWLKFDFPSLNQVDLEVYDYYGRQIRHLNFSSGQGQVDLTDLKTGIYFVKVNRQIIKVLF